MLKIFSTSKQDEIDRYLAKTEQLHKSLLFSFLRGYFLTLRQVNLLQKDCKSTFDRGTPKELLKKINDPFWSSTVDDRQNKFVRGFAL